MARERKVAKESSDTKAVDAYLAALEHPLKGGLQAVREILLGASPRIREGIKWNAPSFRLEEYFATASVRKDVVLVVLHFGAKVKDGSVAGVTIRDPAGLLEWPAKDRALVKFRDEESIESNREAFQDIVRQWIAHMR